MINPDQITPDPTAVEATTIDLTTVEHDPAQIVFELAQQADRTALVSYLDQLSVTDQAFVFSHLDEQQVQLVLDQLVPEHAADLLTNLSETQAAGVINALELPTAAAIVQELAVNEQADLLSEIPPAHAEEILNQLTAQQAAEIRELAAYADDVAGGLMRREMLRIPLNNSIGTVIKLIGEALETLDDDDVRYGYVVDGAGVLVGVLPMQNLLFQKRSATVAETMIKNPQSVHDQTSLDELVDIFDRRNYLGIPVVNADNVLVGVVLREDVDYAEGEVAEQDYLKTQGIVGGEELRTMPTLLRAKRRLSWLSANIFLNLGAASVIAFYEDTLKAVIALAVFLPIISDMSGCSGNQAVAVSMRELSLGVIRPTELLRVWLKELSIGLINGCALGILIAIVAVLYDGNPWLGLVVGAALLSNTVIAVSIGGTLPLFMKRFGVDPAIASGPLLTTITDMCGFFLVLGIASQLLDKLT